MNLPLPLRSAVSGEEHLPDARAFSSEVDTGWRRESAANPKLAIRFRVYCEPRAPQNSWAWQADVLIVTFRSDIDAAQAQAAAVRESPFRLDRNGIGSGA
jgi:hypothetical protein